LAGSAPPLSDDNGPCTIAGSLTIPGLRCTIVAGSANNQLETEDDGALLQGRGILYAPDYAVNAGGVINISCEIAQIYDKRLAYKRTSAIKQTLLEVYRLADEQKQPTNLVANTLAEELFGASASVIC
jgi:glutamate dehydrogenase/leucine dehydrogenase